MKDFLINNFIGIWLVIGILYVLINALVRKFTVEDPMLVIAWVILWPIFFITLIISWVWGLRNKSPKNIKPDTHAKEEERIPSATIERGHS